MVPDLVPLQQPNKALQRDLGGSNDQDVQSLLVNSNGEGYDPYSLSWRYLGAYIDCDPQDMQQGEGSHDRKLSGSGDGDNCDRKVLWAAVSLYSSFSLGNEGLSLTSHVDGVVLGSRIPRQTDRRVSVLRLGKPGMG